jgi:hypothetical protein
MKIRKSSCCNYNQNRVSKMFGDRLRDNENTDTVLFQTTFFFDGTGV